MSSFTSTVKELFFLKKLKGKNKSLSLVDKFSFLKDISLWEKPPKNIHVLFEDPRFFDKKGSLLLKVTGYFIINLESSNSLIKEEKYSIWVLEKDRQIYSLIAYWQGSVLVSLYFSYLPFPLGLSRDLFLKQGFLKDLFIAPEQLDFVLGYLEYSPFLSLSSSYLSLEKRGSPLRERDSLCSFKNESERTGSFKSSLKGERDYSLLWREYSLLESNPYSNEFDTIFLQEMTPSLKSSLWQEKGGEIVFWVSKKIKEKNIEFFI